MSQSRWQIGPGLKFEAHLSKYDVYKDKSYYKLIGKIENRTRSEISQLKGTLTYHLNDGNSVQDVIDIHPTHRSILRPSDSAYFQEIQKISNTTLSSVSLKVAIVASSPASRSYPKSKDLMLKWGDGISSTQYKIAVFERKQSLGSASGFGQYVRMGPFLWKVVKLMTPNVWRSLFVMRRSPAHRL